MLAILESPEKLEKLLDTFGLDADASVGDVSREKARLSVIIHVDADGPLEGELQGVAQQVEKYLLEALNIC